MSSSGPGYIPTPFTKFGKTCKDLLKKNYNFEHTIKTINRSSRKGVSIESGAQFVEQGPVRGFVKAKYSNFGLNSFFKGGEAELELNTDQTQESKANVKFNNIAKGFSLNFLTTTKSSDKAFRRPVGGVEAEYSQEYISLTGTAKSDLDIHKVDGSIALGYDNVSVGASAVVDVTRGSDIVEHNIGAEYSVGEFIASVYTEKNQSELIAAYSQRINRDQLIGAQLKYQLTGRQERSLAVGTEYRVDLDTTIRAKVDLPSGDIAAQIDHKLTNPRLSLGVAAQF